MRIFITGGTGLIGKALINKLFSNGNKITILTRNITKARSISGDEISYINSLNELSSLDEYDAVINLAGEPIAKKRWTKNQKKKLCNSRWSITERLTELINRSSTPPSVFISGSAIGYYGSQSDNILLENSQPNEDFTSQLCQKWEVLALAAESKSTRVCMIRTGLVLSNIGGMLPILSIPFRLGLGSSVGTGKQYMSWIHIEDMLNGISFLLNTPEARGVFNFSAPNPVTNKRFSNILSATIFRPRIFRIPTFALKLVMGERAALIIDSQRAVPKNLLKLNFIFKYGHIDEALKDLLRKP